jgi:hypothetical protein
MKIFKWILVGFAVSLFSLYQYGSAHANTPHKSKCWALNVSRDQACVSRENEQNDMDKVCFSTYADLQLWLSTEPQVHLCKDE